MSISDRLRQLDDKFVQRPTRAPATSRPQPQPAWPAANPYAATPPGRWYEDGSAARAQRQFVFDGGAATYLGTALLAFAIAVGTLMICYPFALVLRERWRAKHSFINGQQMVFTGSAIGLFGLWLKWLLLIVITFGVYSFWVGPRIARWKWEHLAFANSAAVWPTP